MFLVRKYAVAHHHGNVSRGEGESDLEAILVPCAAAAHGIPETQPFERLQSTILPGPGPEAGRVITSKAMCMATLVSQLVARHIFCL